VHSRNTEKVTGIGVLVVKEEDGVGVDTSVRWVACEVTDDS